MYDERCISVTQLKLGRKGCQECSILLRVEVRRFGRAIGWGGERVDGVDRAARGEGAGVSAGASLYSSMGGGGRLGVM